MNKKGFTLIEVILFFALSSGLVALLIAGTVRSISQKRYGDTVDNFVDYLQRLYSDVNYVQGKGISSGNSSQAIYGKLIILSNDGREFSEYTILGKAECNSDTVGSNTAIEVLNKCSPKIMSEEKDGSQQYIEESYKLSWGGTVKEPTGKKIAFMIITHPKFRTKYTYVKMKDTGFSIDNGIFNTDNKFDNGFKEADINFCLSSDDESAAGYSLSNHKLIRIRSGANNASGVEIINDDKRGGLCES